MNLTGIDRHFGNGYLQTWTLGVERAFGKLTADAAYIGTAAVRLPRSYFPNDYSGAGPGFARFTIFDANGNPIGGFGTEQVITDTAHSSYNALQTSLQGTTSQNGPTIQASYTFSKSLDDVSAVDGGTGSTGAVTIPFPQDPSNTHREKGPSAFDVANSFTMSAAQDLQIEKAQFLQAVPEESPRDGRCSVSPPSAAARPSPSTPAFSRPAQAPTESIAPTRSASRISPPPAKSAKTTSAWAPTMPRYFSIPINLPGGTGPNQGYFGALGRNTFRGPAYYDFDFSLIKDTPVGSRSSGGELFDVQFRSEFFNLFNIVNMGLPANTILGSGFGQISRTAGTSRQIQFSLKILY